MTHNNRKTAPIESILNNIFDVSISDVLGSDFISTNPTANVINGDDKYMIQLAAPGLTKSDFTISLKDSKINIEVKKEDAQKEEKKKFTRREFQYDSFIRSFSIDDTVDTSNIDANYEHGILQINLPKKKEAKEKGPLNIEIT